MSALIRCGSRLRSVASKQNRRYLSTVSAESSKSSIISPSILTDLPPPPPPSQTVPPPPPGKFTFPWRFPRLPRPLKYGLIAALTAGVATVSYASYAYSLDEVEQKTKTLRSSYANVKFGDLWNDASSFDKFKTNLQAAAMSVPAKLADTYIDLRRLTEEQVRGFAEPTSDKLLPDLHPSEQHVFTLVLDLNETLISSDWKRERGWRTFKRPGVDDFLEHLAQFYEIVLYSDQQPMFVDPVMERLDPKHCIRYRLSRVDTRYVDGKHYRDLSKLNRDPARVLYISAHALESTLQPENGIPVKVWKGEADDTTLLDLLPFLEYVAKNRPADIRKTIASYQGRDIGKEFIERSKEYQKRMQEQSQKGRLWKR